MSETPNKAIGADVAWQLFGFIVAHDETAKKQADTRDGALKLLADCVLAASGTQPNRG
jgi:hypothetical protein